MSDERLREAERTWKATGSAEAELAFLLERVSGGLTSISNLQLAAHLGFGLARTCLEALSEDCSPPVTHWGHDSLKTRDWLSQLGDWSQQALVRGALAAARLSLERWEGLGGDRSARRAVEAAEAWVLSPSQARQAEAWKAGDAAFEVGYRISPETMDSGLILPTSEEPTLALSCVFLLGTIAAAWTAGEERGIHRAKAHAAEAVWPAALSFCPAPANAARSDLDYAAVRLAILQKLLPWTLGYER